MLNRKNSILILGLVIIAIAVGGTIWYRRAASGKNPAAPGGLVKSIYEVEARDIDGQLVSLDQYRGKTLLIVNVASKCRFTPQYEGLQRLYDKYQSRGLVVLGFPANNFAWREPGTDVEIKEFCTSKYNVTFPIFSKISVAGDDIHPLYRYLTDEMANPQLGGKVTWNLNKYLVAPDGRPVAHFASDLVPESPEIVGAIESVLQ
ncbi:MAG: glutathione peroxidase [Acidobacteriota bacterium]